MTIHIIRRWLPTLDIHAHIETELFTYFLTGLSIITFYANLMSIFYRISFEFFGFLLFITVTCIGLRFRTCTKACKKSIRSIKKIHWAILIAIIYAIVIALISSASQTINLDEGGYYLSIVKWAEQYPLVSGTGLLNARIAYNSAYHMTCAVFGYSYIFDGGAYDLNGLLYVLLHIMGYLSMSRLLTKKSLCISADLLLALALIFPFRFLIDSMDVDYPSIVIGIYIISEILRRIQSKQFFRIDIQIVVLTLISLYLFTVRPFSIFYLTPLLFICCKLLWKRQLVIPLSIALLCLVYVSPWLYRNVMISGYLIYPIYYVDLFSIDWKIPADLAYNNYLLIKEYAQIELIRTDYLYAGVEKLSPQEWFIPWLENNWQLIVGKLVIVALPLSIGYHIVCSFINAKRTSLWVVRNVLLLILLLWFFSFPSIRFAWVFLLAFFVLILYDIIESSESLRRIVVFGVLIAIILSSIRTAKITMYNANISDHLTIPARTVTLDNYIVIDPESQILKSKTEYCYGAIPCMPYHNEYEVQLRGKRIEDGFILKE